jgi:hypothetical protein
MPTIAAKASSPRNPRLTIARAGSGDDAAEFMLIPPRRFLAWPANRR